MRPRILITRAPHQASVLADALRDLGCDPILIPTIELAPPTTFAPLDAALTRLARFDWIIFTSANAAEAFHRRLTQHRTLTQSETLFDEAPSLPGGSRGLQAPEIRPNEKGALAPALPPHLRIASIGPATTLAIEKLFGTKPSLISPTPTAESLAQALVSLTQNPDTAPFSKSFLFPRAEDARNIIETALNSTKAELTIVPAYRNIIPESSIPAIRTLFAIPDSYPNAITFTSSSTAINLIALLEVSGIALPAQIPRISIGPITTQTLHDLHIPPTAEAAEPTISSLSIAVMQVVHSESHPARI